MACIRSQLLLLFLELLLLPASVLDKLWLAADDTPELELVVDVGEVDPRPPGSVFAIDFIIDCPKQKLQKFQKIVSLNGGKITRFKKNKRINWGVDDDDQLMIEYLRGLGGFLDGLDQFEREVVAGVFDEGDHLFVGGPLDIDIADSYDYITFSHSGQLKIN
jgi:hypothetical protein